MRDQLINLLETSFGFPARLQGSLSPKEKYPDSFFTIWNTESADGHHYDNGPIWYTWTFSIFFYSTDPGRVLTVTQTAIEILKARGWIIDGKGTDAPSDEITHTGRTFTATFIEDKEELKA